MHVCRSRLLLCTQAAVGARAPRAPHALRHLCGRVWCGEETVWKAHWSSCTDGRTRRATTPMQQHAGSARLLQPRRSLPGRHGCSTKSSWPSSTFLHHLCVPTRAAIIPASTSASVAPGATRVRAGARQLSHRINMSAFTPVGATLGGKIITWVV